MIPYFGYARQDRKPGPRTPISAKLVANLITEAGADRVLTMELHAGQIQGFFDIPVDNLYSHAADGAGHPRACRRDHLMVVSPDVGGVSRARGFAKRLDVNLAIIDKRRERAGVSEVMNVIGDVRGMRCILVDDIVDSGGTLCNAARCAAGGRCAVGAGLCHPRGALGGRGGQGRGELARAAGDHGQHPAERGRARHRQGPRAARWRSSWARRSAGSRARARSPACSTEPRSVLRSVRGAAWWHAGGAKGAMMSHDLPCREARQRSGKGPARRCGGSARSRPSSMAATTSRCARHADQGDQARAVQATRASSARCSSSTSTASRLRSCRARRSSIRSATIPLHVDFLRAERGCA